MPNTPYLTAPVKSAHMPPGVPYIVANEAAERFSYYGMRAILTVFMTKYLMGSNGLPDHMSEPQAKECYHYFVASAYLFPIFGALMADTFWGKYRTIIYLSLVYCLGHLALALNDTRIGLFTGLALIAIGAGGIKPCVSAHVGDQFGATNQHLLTRVFGWFYFAINFGSSISTIIIPMILKGRGPSLAFALPGILMLLATVAFWMGRNKFVHIPPSGTTYVHETFCMDNLKILGRLGIIYLFVAMFWSLYDQTGSAWVLQAEKMDLQLFGHTMDASQVQAINPILILVYIPLFTYVIYPSLNRVFKLTPLRKIGLGFFLAVSSFLVPAWVESQITAGFKPTIAWQLLSYALLTAAEVLVSITALEFSYTQAPKRMKSIIMSIYLLSVFVGNLFTGLVNHFIQNADGSTKLAGASYYVFFSVAMFVTALVFIFVAMEYREQTFIQDEREAPAAG